MVLLRLFLALRVLRQRLLELADVARDTHDCVTEVVVVVAGTTAGSACSMAASPREVPEDEAVAGACVGSFSTAVAVAEAPLLDVDARPAPGPGQSRCPGASGSKSSMRSSRESGKPGL